MSDCPTNSCVGRKEYENRELLCDERFKRDKEQLERHEQELKELRGLNIQIAEMVKRYDAIIESQDKRIADLEKKPADSFEKIKTVVITAIITAVVTFLMSNILPAVP